MQYSRTITHAYGEARPRWTRVGERRFEFRAARGTARRAAIAQSGGWR